MRKILLATTALVGLALATSAEAAPTKNRAAKRVAAPAPITAPAPVAKALNVTVGGDVEFVAGASHESKKATGAIDATGGDFETLYSIAFGVTGRAANGIEYGGNLVLDNYPTFANGFAGDASGVTVTTADIFLAGAFGKVVLGDMRGATDLAVGRPVIGGIRYTDFVNAGTSFAKDLVVGIDETDYSTNVTYFTPKVGTDFGKFQAGISYVPHFRNTGAQVALVDAASGYEDVIKGAVAYTGAIKNIAIAASADVISGSGVGTVRDFTAFGLGAQAAVDGFTFGATYEDRDDYNTTAAQTKDQSILGAGVKYEFGKVAVGFDYANAEGYSAAGFAADYVRDLTTYNLGAAYTWAPGLTTTGNFVLFSQEGDLAATENDGYVLLVSQKLAF